MLEVSDCISPLGQTTLLINSITVAFLALVQPIAGAGEVESAESDEAYSSEEYDSEDYEDKAPIDIRPLRDSRKKHGNLSMYTLAADASLPTTPETTTVDLSEQEATDLYTGTFKNVHNRDDFNHSGFTLPTIIGTLFTVDLEEWKRTKSERVTNAPKLLDPNMIKLFSSRPNYTNVREFRRFVHWANKQFRVNHSGQVTKSWKHTTHLTTWTLYPKEFENDTAFQQYMSKNWVNTSYKDYQSSLWKNTSGSYNARAWIDKIAAREFHSLPWRNRNASDSRPWRRRWYPGFAEGNDTMQREFASRTWRRRPYWATDGFENGRDEFGMRSARGRRPYWVTNGFENGTDEFGMRSVRGRRPYWVAAGNGTDGGELEQKTGKGKRRYYWTLDGNQTVMKEYEAGPWSRKRQYYGEGNESVSDEWGARRSYYSYGRRYDYARQDNETGPRPWRERRPHPEPWMERPWQREYDAPIDGDSREFHPGVNESRPFEGQSWVKRRPFRDWMPIPRSDRDFRPMPPPPPPGPRPPPPPPLQPLPPRRPEFEPEPLMDRRDHRPFEPPRRDFREFDPRYESREFDRRPHFDFEPPRNRSLSREFEDRPLRARDRDFDDRRPARGRDEFDDRAARDRDVEERMPPRDRDRYYDTPRRDRDFDDRRDFRGRQEFDDRPARDRGYDDRKPARDGDYDDRKPARDRDYDDRKPARDRSYLYEERRARPTNDSSSERTDARFSKNITSSKEEARDTYYRDRDERPSTKDFSWRKTDRYKSISRSDGDFYARRSKVTGSDIFTTKDMFAMHAKIYRQRIEQRREKEIQKIEQKRKRFWRPTESGEDIDDETGSSTASIKTSTRRSYNKLRKNTAGDEAEETIGWPEDEVEESTTVDPNQGVSNPYDDEYMREWHDRREQGRTTDQYDWITEKRSRSDDTATKSMSHDTNSGDKPKKKFKSHNKPAMKRTTMKKKKKKKS